MARIRLTDSKIEAEVAKAEIGKRIEIYDEVAPGLAVRINRRGDGGSDNTSVKFIYVGAIPPSKDTVRRSLEKKGRLTLKEAREKATDWRRLIEAGKDPEREEKRLADEEAAKRRVTFGAMAEAYIADQLPGQKKGKAVERDIRRDLITVLGKRPIAEIDRFEIRDIIKRKMKSAPAQARNLLGYAKLVFKWALDEEGPRIGLKANPCADLKPTDIIGERVVRDRILTDGEIFAFWRATGREPYPYQQIHRLLLLNALRLNEVAKAALHEFDFRKRDWVIPATRMKGKKSKAKPHLVPLTEASLKIIGTLRDMPVGPHLFSSNLGKSGIGVNSDIKVALDASMLKILKAMARKRGDDPKKVELPPWTNHDLRRTARSNFPKLRNEFGQRVAEEVSEAVLAHARPGIKRVYDCYSYESEKFELLQLWADHLASIVDPQPTVHPSNVIRYPGRRHG